jgi:hypothetical protein
MHLYDPYVLSNNTMGDGALHGVPVQVDYVGCLSTQPGEQRGVQEGRWQYVSSYLRIHTQREGTNENMRGREDIIFKTH